MILRNQHVCIEHDQGKRGRNGVKYFSSNETVYDVREFIMYQTGRVVLPYGFSQSVHRDANTTHWSNT